MLLCGEGDRQFWILLKLIALMRTRSTTLYLDICLLNKGAKLNFYILDQSALDTSRKRINDVSVL
jgi:hypothetical protein